MHADHDFRQRSRLLARRGNPVGDATPALGVTPVEREKFIQVKRPHAEFTRRTPTSWELVAAC